jgi:hypothetical protein
MAFDRTDPRPDQVRLVGGARRFADAASAFL